ncbi:DUF3040 domain-containing protein [Pseudonocardia humida]|uniref:DUF3040 domain-containing protein n=1 Tax=Pseudonocardia humida TaxID=2800819 RepID=A0ABT1A6I5_9PSEU|nr:DUF3040 domain-containing protein [Pseudonocardia humida]MCO1658636.1 DUF3040 domain-containing protein [Pseudonocardia humida]
MPVPHPSGPDDHHLSPRERSALERIEQDLAGSDPAFTRRMRGDGYTTVALPRGRRPAVVAAVIGVVLVLVAAPPSWWVLFGLLALMGVATWVLVRPSDPAR